MDRLLTLTTDFGTRDAYVASMKGVILQTHPQAQLLDITHEIAPQDVMEAAFVLREALPHFPPETVHLVVVDPGVGTERRAVALRKDQQWFVGPDNGLFTLLLEEEPPEELVQLDRPAFWHTDDPSTTFHGRDIFAPVAAHLAAGHRLGEVGTPIDALQRLHWAFPITDNQGIQGWVVHIDHFGNCITNISKDLFNKNRDGRPVKSYVGNTILQGTHSTYGAVESGEPLALFGSSGYLEIAVNTGNAADLLSIQKGASVNILFQDEE